MYLSAALEPFYYIKILSDIRYNRDNNLYKGERESTGEESMTEREVRERVTDFGFKCFIITERFNLHVLRYLILLYLPSLGYSPNMAQLPSIPILRYYLISHKGAILLPTIDIRYKSLITKEVYFIYLCRITDNRIYKYDTRNISRLYLLLILYYHWFTFGFLVFI